MVQARSAARVCFILLVFFFISFLTNIIGPLVPDMIQSFQLSLTLASLLPFAFFIAYAVMSIPAGILIERFGEKTVMISAFLLTLAGSLMFASSPTYLTAILSLFLIGVGMACLQVGINPLLRVSGGEENYAFNAVMAQVFFGAASYLSPLVYSYFTTNLHFAWVSIYWLFSALAFGMSVAVLFVSFPKIIRTEEERAGGLTTYLQLLKNKTVWLFFFGLFFYVGLEQGLANWMSQYLTGLGYNPQIEGAQAVAHFWGWITIGSMIGLIFLKFFDSRKVMIVASVIAITAFSFALFGSAEVAIYAFPLVGLGCSVMWSITFSLALNSLSHNHGTFSGILCTGVVGGALMPVVVGSLGDHFGLRAGYLVLYVPLFYLFSMGFWARPLIKNKIRSA
jgi:MFS transporter, FHS family, L-fucose permease